MIQVTVPIFFYFDVISKIWPLEPKNTYFWPFSKKEVKMAVFWLCQLKGIEKASARFYFDGEDLVPSDTSETLYLEGGECIDDVHINE